MSPAVKISKNKYLTLARGPLGFPGNFEYDEYIDKWLLKVDWRLEAVAMWQGPLCIWRSFGNGKQDIYTISTGNGQQKTISISTYGNEL